MSMCRGFATVSQAKQIGPCCTLPLQNRTVLWQTRPWGFLAQFNAKTVSAEWLLAGIGSH